MTTINDNYQEETTEDQKEFKFCFCMNVKQGYNVVGVLEVLGTIWQIVTVFSFSLRVGLTMLIIFNLPLLAIYIRGKMVKNSSKYDDYEKNELVYKYSTMFLYLYLLRLIFIIISGFIMIIFLENNHTTAEFICDRYSYLDYENDK